MKDEKEKTKKTTKKTTPKKVNEEPKKKVVKKKEIKPEEIKEVKESDMQVINKTVEFSLLEVIIIVLITGIVVSITSGLIVYNNYDKINVKEQTITDSDYKEFVENYNLILNNYVEEIDGKSLLDAAIAGMYAALGDGYSAYLTESDTLDLEEQLNGEYTGIGVEIRTDVLEDGSYQTVINKIFKDTPAERAGLRVGDILLKVDDVQVESAQHVADTIKRGNKDTYNITYKRDGVEATIPLTREKVFINSVETETFDNIGYIKLDTFSSTTKDQIVKALDSFDKKVNSLIIDVRNNTGGYLSAAEEVADLFVEKGKNIYQLKDRSGNISEYKAEHGVHRKFNKIAVLINNGSASASEILALALKESAGAKLVGTTSFGKGTVQDTKQLSSGAMVKVTTSYWLSPKGNSINNVGIKPDKEVKDESKQLDEAKKVVK